MRRRYILLCVFIMTVGTLIFCGMWMGRQAAAPMARERWQVSASLTVLPEKLFDAELLAYGGNPIVHTDGGTLYEVLRQSCRRMELPIEGSVSQITPSPDGGLWLVLETTVQTEGYWTELEETRLVKLSAQGTVLINQPLGWSDVSDLACDSVGRVYIVNGNGTEVQRLSPEGEPQGTLELQTDFETAKLVVQKDRIFAAYYKFKQKQPQLVKYREITEDFQLGKRYYGCVKVSSWEEIPHMGSFLPEYVLMEYDDVGLYACREDGVWETVALWEDLHLDGSFRGSLLSDAQGRGTLLYEKNGETYVLNLSQRKK